MPAKPILIIALILPVLFSATDLSVAEEPLLIRPNTRIPVYIEPGPVEQSVLYANGAVINVETHSVWKPLCAGDPSKVTVEDLKKIAAMSKIAAAALPAPQPPVGNVALALPPRFTLVFNTTAAVPAAARAALVEVEHYIEAQFTDPITVTINFDFAALPPGVLGGTSSNYGSVTWPVARDALINGMDLDDIIQSFVPPGSTIPVRYDGNTATVTNENRVFVTIANYRAAIGTLSGTAASMTFSSVFSWDYTPPSIDSGAYDFQSVIVHEVGHALGFTSGADFRTNDMEMLDVFRFQRSDGTGTNYNPDTYADFTTTARMVDLNAPGTNDDVNSDLITAEYQMSDGNPNQASHFHDQNPPIGIMDPTIASGQTFYPNFYRIPDLAMFDAIGWDYPHFNTTCPASDLTACNTKIYFDNLPNSNAPAPRFSCGNGNLQVGALWYSFVATHTSAHISTCDSVAADTTFAVYGGDCASLVEIACSEDGGCDGGGARSSMCVTGLTPGNTYYIQVASRNNAGRGVIALQIDCSCVGACCFPPPASCLGANDDACATLGGSFVGGGTTCLGDVDQDGRDDKCQASFTQFSQLPTPSQEDVASNIDWSDKLPNAVMADNFITDGRAIRSVRWWGSKLDAGVNPDGWLVSFHEPLTPAQPPAASLGLYFCPVEKVASSATTITGCDTHPVIKYSTRLIDCCLMHAGADSRSAFVPAVPGGFLAETCADYALGIQAVLGARFDPDGFGTCIETATGGSAIGDFWGWHSTIDNEVAGAAMTTPLTTGGVDLLFGPWATASTSCGNPDLSFELLTSDVSPGSEIVIWSNGAPDNLEALNSQFGGARTDWMTVDDVAFPHGAAITDLHWLNEEDSAFAWDGRVRLEIYPDSGSGVPNASGGATLAMWVPDDGGVVVRTSLGAGQFFPRYRYDMTGLNIALPAGNWWIGIATAGASGSTGRAYWLTSHKQGVAPLFFGSESYLRAPSAGIASFVPWSTQVSGNKYDMAFDITTKAIADCNCNGVPDNLDVGTTSADCNANGIPDECEPDCNANGVPDDCDIAQGTSRDCQPNGVPDECDIFFGTSVDADGNGLPDECCLVIAPPQRDPSDFDKVRFITLPPPAPGLRAIRVRLVSLHHPNPAYTGDVVKDFSSFENEVRWVGPPTQFVESSASQTPFKAATLQCAPYYADWSTVGTLHVTGREVVPSSVYNVQWITSGCVEASESSFSAPLTIATRRWGDVDEPFSPPSPSPQPDTGDISAMVNKFKSAMGAPIKARALLVGDVPDMTMDVDFTHIAACVDAFKGLGFPNSGPAPCGP